MGAPVVTGRSLVNERLFGQIARRVVEHNNGVTEEAAELAADQALAFLATLPRERRLYPSQLVDKGWHAFLLDTPAYMAFGQRIAGGFIHHIPHNTPGAGRHQLGIADTMRAITDAGFVVDERAWAVPANCGNSGCGGGPPPAR